MNNTTVDALKDVYTELGGSAATVASMQTDAEVIEALSALVGSTIELPAVTAEDDGDVLTVVNGAWSKAEASGGLPEVTSADEGDVLTVNSSGEWVAENLPKELFIATAGVSQTVLTKLGSAFTANFGKSQKDVYDEYVASNIDNAVLKISGSSGDAVYFSLVAKPTNKLVFGLTWVDVANSGVYFHKMTIDGTNSTTNTATTEFAKYTIV